MQSNYSSYVAVIIAIVFWIVFFIIIRVLDLYLFSVGNDTNAYSAGEYTLTSHTPLSGKEIFHKCAVCHSVYPEQGNKVGPNLYNIVGRKIASSPHFSYSKAFQNYAKDHTVWTKQSLDSYLKNPAEEVPGNRMSFPGIVNDEYRKKLISYLAGNGRP